MQLFAFVGVVAVVAAISVAVLPCVCAYVSAVVADIAVAVATAGRWFEQFAKTQPCARCRVRQCRRVRRNFHRRIVVLGVVCLCLQHLRW